MAHLQTALVSFPSDQGYQGCSLASLAGKADRLLRNCLEKLETYIESCDASLVSREKEAISEHLRAAVAMVDGRVTHHAVSDYWTLLAERFGLAGLHAIAMDLIAKAQTETDDRRYLETLEVEPASTPGKLMFVERSATGHSFAAQRPVVIDKQETQNTREIITNFENPINRPPPRQVEMSGEAKATNTTPQVSNDEKLQLKEVFSQSRADSFFNNFIQSNIVKSSKPSDLKSVKQSSKATSNASVINLKANKAVDFQGAWKTKACRRVLSNGIATKMVIKPAPVKQAFSQYLDRFGTSNSRAPISSFNSQRSETQDYLMNYMDMEFQDAYVCPDSPNHESTQSGSGWQAAKAQTKRLDMPSPAKSTHSVTKDNLISASKIVFGRLERTPEKHIPKGLFKNSTNMSKDLTKNKVISKSKLSLGKESSFKVSAAKISGLKLNKFGSGIDSSAQRINSWDTDIVAFGTPVKEDYHYTESDGRFHFKHISFGRTEL